jgi:hypothetical protein
MPVMTEYDFTQQVDYPSVLVANIQASSISTPLVNIETSGSGPTMAVSLFFSDVLSSIDQTTLNSVMAAYVNSLPVLQSTINQIIKDTAFGMNIIAQFGAANRIANLNTSQIIQIAEQLAPIQLLLSTGSIQTALVAIENITPNSLLTQETINTYVTQLQNYINSES